MEAMRRKILEEQLAALDQAKRQQQDSIDGRNGPSSQASSSSSSSNPAISSLPHRNKHAPPPRVKLYQPPLVPYHPLNSGAGTGSLADPIVFGETSSLGASPRSNPFQNSANFSSSPIRPTSSSASSYAASQPFQSPNSKSSQAPFISPTRTPPRSQPLQNKNPFYDLPLTSSSPLRPKSRPKHTAASLMSDFRAATGSAPPNHMHTEDAPSPASWGQKVDANERDKQMRDLVENMVNITDISDDAKISDRVTGLKCTLLPHQVQGVTWMRERERGKAKGGILADDMGLGKTVQTLALIVSNRPGQPDCTIDLDVPIEGGRRGKQAGTSRQPEDLPRLKMPSKTTLIVAPLAVIKQWEREVVEKTDAGLKVLLYHGPSRAKTASQLAKYDVVVTTYTTVSSEFGQYMQNLNALAKGDTTALVNPSKSKSKTYSKAKTASKSKMRSPRVDSDAESGSDDELAEMAADDSDSSQDDPVAKKSVKAKKAASTPLFDFTWLRIVLDEAQNIKNYKAKCSRACSNLSSGSISRWCLTGTPLQNDASEMYSLFHFLCIPPYNDYKTFKEQIGDPIKANHQGRVNAGMRRLKFALETTMLRRTKDHKLDDGRSILNLPKRDLKLIELEFEDDQEKEFYMTVQERARKAFEDADQKAKNGKGNNMIAGLVLLLRLRQACSHPFMVTGSIRTDAAAIGSAAADDAKAGPGSSHEGGSSEPAVGDIGNLLDDDDDGLAAMLSGLSVATKHCDQCSMAIPANAPVFSQSNGDDDHRKLCVECNDLLATCHEQGLISPSYSSTKIRKMLELLSSIRANDPFEKTIVFSQFTSFLNLVEPHLRRTGLRFVRYDGSMRQPEREAALDRIRTDPKTTVILISFKAGSTGLNLTCCSRVILMDLWWNPQIEEQAFDRAHRLGQTKDVTIYKLSIKDTVEERILKLQEKKRALANAALAGDKLIKGSKKGLNMQELLVLLNGNDGFEGSDQKRH